MKIPDLWKQLSQPGIITLAINRAIDRIDSTFWFCGDEEFTTQYGNILPGPGPDTTKTVQIVSLNAGKEFKPGTPWVPFNVQMKGKGWGHHLNAIYHFPTSDLQSLQVLHGAMVAATTFLVGVDHAIVDNLTHGFEITGMDLVKQQNIHDDKYGDEYTPYQAMVEQGYRMARREFQRTGRRIYTTSPVENTVVKKYIPYMPFDVAIERSLWSAEQHTPLDMGKFLSWEPYANGVTT